MADGSAWSYMTTINLLKIFPSWIRVCIFPSLLQLMLTKLLVLNLVLHPQTMYLVASYTCECNWGHFTILFSFANFSSLWCNTLEDTKLLTRGKNSLISCLLYFVESKVIRDYSFLRKFHTKVYSSFQPFLILLMVLLPKTSIFRVSLFLFGWILHVTFLFFFLFYRDELISCFFTEMSIYKHLPIHDSVFEKQGSNKRWMHTWEENSMPSYH